MRLASFLIDDRVSFGVVHDHGIVDIGRAVGSGMLADHLVDLVALNRFIDRRPDYQIEEVTLLPPVPDSRRIICIGLNYRAHIEETGSISPAHPILFSRHPGSLVGCGTPLVRPKMSEQFDFEGELALVIGRPGRHIPPETALEHVAGYACFNDGSIRDYQRHTSQFLPGKNFEHSGSFGPWLVTRDEAGDVNELTLTTRLNGKVVQHTSVDDLLFGVEALIAYVSQIWTVLPGDIIATGTPSGVGAARKPPLWMKPGDLIEVEIDRLGTLSNTVMTEDDMLPSGALT
jgi:2-keto-4-pentenoate hydratase/2-oxohepta-3-ene-1,7-dioic acid hydratase in catechol pathway